MKSIIVIVIVVAIGWYGNYLYKQRGYNTEPVQNASKRGYNTEPVQNASKRGYNTEPVQNASTDLANEQKVKCITKTGSVIYGTVPQGTLCEKLEPIEGSLTVVSSETRTERESGYNSSKENSRGSSFRCDGRVHCSQMTSRAEAEFFVRNCPNTKMDGDRDGIPCERDSRF